MNNRMEHHPANQLTHILVHQPDDIRAPVEEPHPDWVDDKCLYSANMEL